MDSDGPEIAGGLYRRGRCGELDDIGSRGRTSVFVGDDVVLKVFLADTDKPDREVAGLRVAAASRLQVPRLSWAGELDGFRAVLVGRLEGTQPTPASDGEWRQLSEATGAVARELHRPVPAFGAWTVSPHDTAAELLVARVTTSAATVRDQDVIDRSLVDRCHRWVVGRAEQLAAHEPVHVHRDLSDRNVFGAFTGTGWDLTAVIDFESSGGGVPEEEARWPALLELGGMRPEGTLEAFTRGYGAALDRDVIDVFVVDLAIDVMSYAGHRNPTLMDAALAAARSIVDG